MDFEPRRVQAVTMHSHLGYWPEIASEYRYFGTSITVLQKTLDAYFRDKLVTVIYGTGIIFASCVATFFEAYSCGEDMLGTIPMYWFWF